MPQRDAAAVPLGVTGLTPSPSPGKFQDAPEFAVPEDSLPEGGGGLAEYASRNGGEIPATDFLVHDFNPYELVKAITHMFELRLRVHSIEDIPVRIVSLADIRKQD